MLGDMGHSLPEKELPTRHGHFVNFSHVTRDNARRMVMRMTNNLSHFAFGRRNLGYYGWRRPISPTKIGILIANYKIR